MHGVLGTPAMSGSRGGARRLSGDRVPQWTPSMPRGSHWTPRRQATTSGATASSTSRAARRARWDRRAATRSTICPTVTERVLRRAGYDVVYPPQLERPVLRPALRQQGPRGDAAVAKADELEAALRAASEGGRLPIVFDTSPCAYRMKQALQERLPVFDLAEFLHDHVLPRLTIRRTSAPVAVHPVCSIRKMGLESKVEAVAQRVLHERHRAAGRHLLRLGGRPGLHRSRNSTRTRCARCPGRCPLAARPAIRAAAPARSD